MTPDLKQIIESSSFEVIHGTYIYAKVRSVTTENHHFMITQDKDEITVITQDKNIDKLDLVERNKESYSLIALNVSVPFYAVGFLAAVSNAVGQEGINILIVSTYSKDYILVTIANLEKTKQILSSLGLHQQ